MEGIIVIGILIVACAAFAVYVCRSAKGNPGCGCSCGQARGHKDDEEKPADQASCGCSDDQR